MHLTGMRLPSGVQPVGVWSTRYWLRPLICAGPACCGYMPPCAISGCPGGMAMCGAGKGVCPLCTAMLPAFAQEQVVLRRHHVTQLHACDVVSIVASDVLPRQHSTYAISKCSKRERTHRCSLRVPVVSIQAAAVAAHGRPAHAAAHIRAVRLVIQILCANDQWNPMCWPRRLVALITSFLSDDNGHAACASVR